MFLILQAYVIDFIYIQHRRAEREQCCFGGTAERHARGAASAVRPSRHAGGTRSLPQLPRHAHSYQRARLNLKGGGQRPPGEAGGSGSSLPDSRRPQGAKRTRRHDGGVADGAGPRGRDGRC